MQKRKRVTTNKEIPRNNESFALLHLQMYLQKKAVGYFIFKLLHVKKIRDLAFQEE